MAGSGPVGGGGDWVRGGIATVLADLTNQGVTTGVNGIQNIANNYLLQTAPNMMNSAAGASTNYADWLTPMVYNAPSMLQSAFGNTNTNAMNAMQGQNAYTNPLLNGASSLFGAATQGMGQAGTSMLDYAGNVNNRFGTLLDPLDKTAGLAGQSFASGGWTPQYQQGFDQISKLLNGGIPGLQSAPGTAESLIGGQGANAFNQGAEQTGAGMMATGGWTPQLSMALNPTQAILNAGGNTGQSNALMSAASPYLQTGGQTELSQGLANRGMQLAGGQALMTPDQAASLAGNQAATQFADQAKQAEAQAMRRGGGAGAVVANGMQNQGMADFADQAAQGISGAVTNALQGQQQLNLNQQGQGLGAAQGAGGLQNNMLGTVGGMAQGSGQLANTLMGTGLGEVPSLTNAAANYLSPFESYAMGGAQNQLGRLGQGGNLAGLVQQGQLGGISDIGSLMSAENQYALGMGGLQNQITQGMGNMGLQSLTGAGNLYNNVGNLGGTQGQLGLGQGQLGVGQAGAMTNLYNALGGNYNTSIGNMNQMGTVLNNMYSNATNPLQAIMSAYGGLANTGLGGLAQLFSGGMNASQAQSPLIGQLIGMIGAGMKMIP